MRPYTFVTLLIILVTGATWLWTSPQAQADPLTFASPMENDLPEPSPELTPSEVIRLQMQALQNNDDPQPDAGITTAYRFASPANKAVTGPLPRFIRMVNNPQYRALIDCRSFSQGKMKLSPDEAVQVVKVVDRSGEAVYYAFQLIKQTEGEYEDCWMTAGVMRVQQDRI